MAARALGVTMDDQPQFVIDIDAYCRQSRFLNSIKGLLVPFVNGFLRWDGSTAMFEDCRLSVTATRHCVMRLMLSEWSPSLTVPEWISWTHRDLGSSLQINPMGRPRHLCWHGCLSEVVVTFESLEPATSRILDRFPDLSSLSILSTDKGAKLRTLHRCVRQSGRCITIPAYCCSRPALFPDFSFQPCRSAIPNGHRTPCG